VVTLITVVVLTTVVGLTLTTVVGTISVVGLTLTLTTVVVLTIVVGCICVVVSTVVVGWICVVVSTIVVGWMTVVVETSHCVVVSVTVSICVDHAVWTDQTVVVDGTQAAVVVPQSDPPVPPARPKPAKAAKRKPTILNPMMVLLVDERMCNEWLYSNGRGWYVSRGKERGISEGRHLTPVIWPPKLPCLLLASGLRHLLWMEKASVLAKAVLASSGWLAHS